MKNLILLFLLFCTSYPLQAQTDTVSRPSKWAIPVLSKHNKNLYQLNKDVYRSEQPDTKGFEELSKKGLVSVLNLRENQTDSSETKNSSLELYFVPMEAENIRDKEIIDALKIIKNAKKPILIHCQHGADRTGVVCAMYRIVLEGWTRKEALDELLYGGFGFHTIFRNIPEYIKNVDIESIKSKLQAP